MSVWRRIVVLLLVLVSEAGGSNWKPVVEFPSQGLTRAISHPSFHAEPDLVLSSLQAQLERLSR